MIDMNKIVSIGNSSDGMTYCKIVYKDGRLSISGVEGPRRGGNCKGSCGQILTSYREYDPKGYKGIEDLSVPDGWTHDLQRQFFDTWQRWHLNDMRAGTPRQEAYLRKKNFRVTHYQSYYDEACKALSAAGINPDEGYIYGTKWLTEEVPAEVLDFLAGLPETRKTPAWV